ncbi:MAG: hypothetical protein V4649_16390 [Bacteroidota bacterium]
MNIKKLHKLKSELANANSSSVVEGVYWAIHAIVGDYDYKKSYLNRLEKIPFISHMSKVNENKITLNGIIDDLIEDSVERNTYSNVGEIVYDVIETADRDFVRQNSGIAKGNRKKIFISHASKDEAKIRPLIDLIEGIGVPHNDIFYSSHPAYGINLGEDIFESLKSVLNSEILALFLLSDNFYKSAICMCEMGAVWIKTNKQIPILIPPFDYSEIKGVFPNSLAIKLNDKDQLNNLKITIEERFKLTPIHPSRWEEKRGEYLTKVNAKLSITDNYLNAKADNSLLEQTKASNYINGFGISEIDNTPDLKMLLAHFLDKDYVGMSFENIKKYVNPEFTEEHLMNMIKKHPLIIRRGKLKTGDFGVLLIRSN